MFFSARLYGVFDRLSDNHAMLEAEARVAGMSKKPTVVVVGAGTAGLAAAHTLLKQKAKLDVTVLEAADHPGGRMAGEEVNGFYVDHAASLFLESYATARSLAKDLGVPLKRSPHTKGGYVYSHGSFCEVYAGGTLKQRLKTARTLLSFRLLSLKGILQLGRFMKLAKSRRDVLDIDDQTKLLHLDVPQSFQDFMEENGMGEYLHQWVTNDIRAYTGGGPEQSGAASSLALLWNFSLNSDEHVAIPETGLGSFATALARACSENMRLSTPVKRIVIDNGAVRGVVTEAGESIEADSVICCTTATIALSMMPDLPAEIKAVLGSVQYSACCKIVIGLDFDLLPEGAYAAVFPRGSGTPLVAVENAKAVAPKSAPAGKSMVNCLVMEDDARALFPLSDAEIASRVIEEIRRFFPQMTRKPEFVRIYRWYEGGCLIHGGMLKAVYEMRHEQLPSVKGLFLAGDYTHLPVTNGAMRSGVDAAKDCMSFVSPRVA